MNYNPLGDHIFKYESNEILPCFRYYDLIKRFQFQLNKYCTEKIIGIVIDELGNRIYIKFRTD